MQEPSLIQGRLFGARVAKWCIYLLIGFPIINYALNLWFRNSLGPLWNEIALGLLSLIALIRYIKGYRPALFGWSKFAWWYILFCAGMLLMGLASPSVSFSGFGLDVQYIAFGLLLPFVVDAEEIPKYLHAAVMVSALLAVDGVFQYVIKVPIPSDWLDVGERVRTRVFSVYGSPAEFGANFEMMLPIMFGLFLTTKNRVLRLLYIFAVLCSMAALVFTFDRGSWLGIGLAVLLVAVFFDKRLLLLFIALALLALLLPAVQHRISDLFSPVYYIKSAQGGRILRWEQAFNKMVSNPLFGAGLGRYGGGIAAVRGFSLYSDSYYAKVLGETGIVGLVLFISIHVAVVREMVKTVVRRARGLNRYLALAGLTGTMAIIVHNFVENLYEYPPTVLLYYLMVGFFLLWGRSLKNKQDEVLPSSKHPV